MRISILMAAAALYAGPSVKSEEPKPAVDVSESEDDEDASVGKSFRDVLFLESKVLDNTCFPICKKELLEEKLSLLKKEIDNINPEDKQRMIALIEEINKWRESKSSVLNELRALRDQGDKAQSDLVLGLFQKQEAQSDANHQELKDINSRYAQLGEATLKVLRVIDDKVRGGGKNDKVEKARRALYKGFGIIVRYAYSQEA